MRINKRLVSISPKRQPGDLERELNILKVYYPLYLFKRDVMNAATILYNSFTNLFKNVIDIFRRVWGELKELYLSSDEEKERHNVTQKLPEFPKMQRFVKDMV